jgi:type IV secretion system protein VirD4
MLERAKAAFGWPAFAKATARQGGQAGPDDAAHPAMLADVVSDFPRGLPDGDIRKPLGTARWIASHEACGLLGEWKPGRFLIGRDSAGRYVGHDDDRHVLCVAGSRAGKGISLIVPNLLHWPGSCIAIDPKGELATITASRRSSVDSRFSKAMEGGGKVFVLDPFERVTGPAVDFRAAFNPLADLDADTDTGLEMAGQIADALVIQQHEAGSHWTQSARSFLRGLILFVCKTDAPVDRHLIRVRELLLQPKTPFNAMLDRMGLIDGVIGRAGHSLNSKPDAEKWSVLSTCDVQTDFLEGGAMARVLKTHDFKLEDLKTSRVTVYLCLPATRLATHGRWLRMMIGLTLEAMERTGPLPKGKPPVLFCLDEFAALGHMESIEKAAGQVASFGVKLWPVIQDLTQLQRDYKQAWETFVGNAGLLTFFGNTDLTTLDHISKRLGVCEVIRTVINKNENWQSSTGGSRPGMLERMQGQGGISITEGTTKSGGWQTHENLMQAPLMQPDEIARLFAREAKNILAFVPSFPPMALNRCAYFGDDDKAMFGGKFDPPSP